MARKEAIKFLWIEWMNPGNFHEYNEWMPVKAEFGELRPRSCFRNWVIKINCLQSILINLSQFSILLDIDYCYYYDYYYYYKNDYYDESKTPFLGEALTSDGARGWARWLVGFYDNSHMMIVNQQPPLYNNYINYYVCNTISFGSSINILKQLLWT